MSRQSQSRTYLEHGPKIAVVELRDPPRRYEQQSYDFFPAYDFVFNSSRDSSSAFDNERHQQRTDQQQYQWQPRWQQQGKPDWRLHQARTQNEAFSSSVQFSEHQNRPTLLVCDCVPVNDTLVALTIIAMVLVVMLCIYVIIDLDDGK